MQMKKNLLVLLVPLLFLAGLFFWKGGHHALCLAGALDEWLDSERADQTVTVQFQQNDCSVNENGRLESLGNQQTLSADSFWTDYGGERLIGLTAEGITIYLNGRNLYLDTGRSYALPQLPELEQSINRLSLGLLLYGRVTKTGDTYHISMNTKQLKLSASITADSTVRSMTVNAVLPDETSIHVSVTSRDPVPHPIPQQVADAIDQARTEPPMSLAEPLEMLLPAAEKLLPLSGDLKLGISCGILDLSETVQLQATNGKAVLTRKGKSLNLELPVELSHLSPLAMSALLLREGEFTRTECGAQFTVNLSADAATGLLTALVPQAADLGITLDNSTLCLQITKGCLSSADLTAGGSVPFLFTTIPVDFTAELTIS